jgi:hypothetical protein
MFDAKIITHYHQNPYVHKALDYPGDPMLSFMHWTQRVYPYGPAWLVLTVPLSFLGFGFFLPTFFLFKLLAAGSYLGCLFFIGKISQKLKPEREAFGLIFFGLQPLILIESLVSGHIDITMMFFALWSVYFLLQKRYLYSLLLLAVSIGIKFATGLLIPVFLLPFVIKRSKKQFWHYFFFLSVLLMSLAVVIAGYRSNFQPWYLMGMLSFAVFIADEFYIFIPACVISFFAMFTYIPFLYTGNWNPPVPQILAITYDISYVISAVLVVIYFLAKCRPAKSHSKQ